ncbi:radical SAM protein [Thermococcus sp.]
MKVNKYILRLNLEKDKILLVNLLTQKVLLCDSELVDILYNQLREDDIKINDPSVLELLKQSDILVSFDEDQYLKRLVKEQRDDNDNFKFHGFEFVLNWECNFACNFCIQKKKWDDNSSISLEKLDRAILFVEKYGKMPPYVTISGGEPLLPRNFSVVKTLLEYLAERNGKLAVTTNGFTLQMYIPLFEQYHSIIDTIRISITGPPEIHNRMRIHKMGMPTFDIVFNNLKKTLDTKLCSKIKILTHFNNKNIIYLDAWIKLLKKEGLLGTIPITFSILENGGTYSSTTLHEFKKREQLSQKLVEYFLDNLWVLKYINVDNGRGDFQIVKDIILNGKLPDIRMYHCNGLAGRAAVMSPDGGVYPCVIAAREGIFKIGTYSPEQRVDVNMLNKVRERNMISMISECKNCSLLPICVGGCPFSDLSLEELNRLKNGNISLVKCKSCMNKKLIEEDISNLFYKFKITYTTKISKDNKGG